MNSAAHFIALIESPEGERYDWPRGTLIENRRDELAVLNADAAAQLIQNFEAWSVTHDPPAAPRKPYVPEPLVRPGERLLYGNLRARAALERAGLHPAPVQFGEQLPPRSVDTWKSCREHGVGLLLNPQGVGHSGKLVTVELSSRSAEIADQLAKLKIADQTDKALPALGAMIASRGAPCRRERNGSLLFVFRNDDYTFNPIERLIDAKRPEGGSVPGTTLRLRITSREGVVVISGDDASGKPLKWDVDWLAIKRSDLPPLSENLLHGFLQDVSTFMSSGEALRVPSKKAATPRKRRKAKAA